MRIYADHAATTRLAESAFEAMKPYLLEEYGNASQLYSFARGPKRALKEARETIAGCIGAESDEIFFTSGGTESDNWALKGMMLFQEEKAIVTSAIEHHAVLHTCKTLERLGCRATYLPVGSEGYIDPTELERCLSGDVKIVSIMYANNEIGTIQPIRELADITHQNGAVFHTDAVQAIGHVPINVKTLDVDLLSASAHKFNGPKGVGFLYVRNGTMLHPYADGGGQEKRLRAGTENVAGIVGMAAALKQNCQLMTERSNHIVALEMYLLRKLKEYGLDVIRNGGANHIPGNISLSFRNADGEALLHRLDFMGICVSTGSACNAVSTEVSHVIKAIGLPDEYAFGTIRISLGYENTFEEMEEIAKALQTILKPAQ